MRVVEAAEAEVKLRRGERRTHICVPVRLVRKMRCRFGCSVDRVFGTQNTVRDAKLIWVVGCMLCWRMEIVLKTFYSYLSTLTKPRRVNLRFMLRAQLFLL